MKMSNIRIWMGVCCLLVLTGCTEKKSLNHTDAISVKTMTVDGSVYAGERTYVGTVKESYGSALSFAMMGTVANVMVDEGQFVKKGQVLACIDRTSMKNAYDIALSSLKQARDAFGRMDMLYKKGSLPEIKYVEIQTKLAEAQSGERIARKNLQDCVLTAPFSGYISQRSVDMGNNVVPGMACFRLVKLDCIEVNISVPEKEIATIHQGRQIRFHVNALGERQFIGIVTKKGVQANPLSHTYEVTVSLANRDHALLPGMVCSVAVNSVGMSKGIVVPQDAIMIDGSNSYVWIADNGKAEKRIVTTDGVSNQGVIITGGIENGAKVIVSGQNKVSDGSAINEK